MHQAPDPHARRAAPLRRALAALLIAAPLLIGAVSLAALRPKVESPHGKFHEPCELCHGANGWKPAKISAKFDHSKYGFRLEGAHSAAKCGACHATLEFTQSKTLCQSCHEDPHRGEMGPDCARCHGARSFVDRAPMVRAHQMTRFPLTGSHAGLECESCHPPAAQGRMQFVNTQAECRNCHMEQYRSAKTPDHVAGSYPLECQNCHSTLTWSGAQFNHDRTTFPLTGAHRAAACQQCHGDGVYHGKSAACASCHQSDYDGASPNHLASGFAASACASCHNTTSWSGASFDHAATRFPLTGAHRTAACTGCHGDGVYHGKSTDCVSCHQTDYNGATPNHVAAGFAASACATCHTTTTWSGGTFDHDTSWFPIYTGRHAGRWTTCETCHTSPTNYAVFTCLSCHPHDDQTQTNSNHGSVNGYRYESNACYSCHPRGRP